MCRQDGCELLLAVLGRHEIFGVVSLFEPVAGETRLTALTEVLAVPIERGQLLSWMAECPELSARTLRLFARRAKEMTDALDRLCLRRYSRPRREPTVVVKTTVRSAGR